MAAEDENGKTTMKNSQNRFRKGLFSIAIRCVLAMALIAPAVTPAAAASPPPLPRYHPPPLLQSGW